MGDRVSLTMVVRTKSSAANRSLGLPLRRFVRSSLCMMRGGSSSGGTDHRTRASPHLNSADPPATVDCPRVTLSLHVECEAHVCRWAVRCRARGMSCLLVLHSNALCQLSAADREEIDDAGCHHSCEWHNSTQHTRSHRRRHAALKPFRVRTNECVREKDRKPGVRAPHTWPQAS